MTQKGVGRGGVEVSSLVSRHVSPARAPVPQPHQNTLVNPTSMIYLFPALITLSPSATQTNGIPAGHQSATVMELRFI